MALWERVFASVYDRVQAPAERGWMGRRRHALLEGVSGRVLEIGAGSGANVPHYRHADEVVVTEPSDPMRARVRARLADAAVPIELIEAGAERLPFADDDFDAVVATLVLCTVDDVAASLAEVDRVLRPGGRLLFIEHGGCAPGRRGVWQRRLDPVWTRLSCGCHLDRDARANIEAAGLRVEEVEEFDPKGVPALLRPFVQGVARKTADATES